MTKSRFTEAQIIGVLREQEAGGPTYFQLHQSLSRSPTGSGDGWTKGGVTSSGT